MVEARSEADLIADCVHCGFCLPACPTYVSWGLEADSPRGRIDLMKGLSEGAIDLTDAVVEHFDRCLGCMSCVTACPSGVRYDVLIESTRAKIETSRARGPADRAFRELLFTIFPYPGRLRALAYPLALMAQTGLRGLLRRSGLLRALPQGLAQLLALAPDLSAPEIAQSFLPPLTAATGRKRGRVALVAGCVQRVFFPNVNLATLRVLSAEGFEVVVPAGQGCCGALSLHVGRAPEAQRFAQALIARFEAEDVDAILVNAAGCGSTLKEYGELFAGDPAWRERAAAFASKVKDINEFLAGVEAVAPRREMPLRAAYHDACHLAHAQRIRSEPRALLATIPGLELVEIAQGDQCCGSAGVYNLLEPQSAAEIGARKADNILAARPDVLVSANPGCTLQIRTILEARGETLLAAHPIELLDAALGEM
jgi:glycolate oxidase iron-sulfur subunit